jgi:hypothetical protein
MELPNIDSAVLLQPGIYEGTLVGAGVLGTALTFFGWRVLKPWWEARTMKMEKEVADRKRMAANILYMLRGDVEHEEMSLEAAEMWFKRFASLLPLKELMKEEGYQTLKEMLKEKHKEEPTTVVQLKTGALARMSARLKPATA